MTMTPAYIKMVQSNIWDGCVLKPKLIIAIVKCTHANDYLPNVDPKLSSSLALPVIDKLMTVAKEPI